jgi:hypothetical protein
VPCFINLEALGDSLKKKDKIAAIEQIRTNVEKTAF